MTTEVLPAEPDRLEGAPHPRDTRRLLGQSEAEAAFLSAVASGRLHHGWLITGPRGVGKATLAWRLARFLLTSADPSAGPGLLGAPPAPVSLDAPEDHPVLRRMAAGAEPRLFVLRRPWDEDNSRLRKEITVDEVRRLKSFFTLTAADGGRRVAIVDAADELNTSAANALLKLLEEPPERAVLLLVAHQPSALLPTIRSRCRALRLRPLGAADLDAALAQAGFPPDPGLHALSGGSVGMAMRLALAGGPEAYADLIAVLAGPGPGIDRPAALALANSVAGKGAEARLDLVATLLDLFLARVARTGAAGPLPEAAPGEAEALARLAPGPDAARGWADLHQTLGARLRHGRSVNLDPASLVLDMVLRIDDAAGRLAIRG